MQYQVKLVDIAEEFSLEQIYLPENIDEIYVRRSDVSRPGLPLAGYFEYFENGRIQMIGNMEHGYLSSLGAEARFKALDDYLSHDVVAVVVTTSLDIFPELYTLVSSLSVSLAERITRHGVLVEVYGEGILMLGDSGIGKSETAIELVKRGHRLIADDAVEIKRVSAKTLVGSAPELIRHYIELRGIGIVDVRRIFGMGAVKETEKIDLVIHFEVWEQGKIYERFGMDTEYTDILGIRVPSITLPVKPGRNLAVIIEIAAMNNRQKKMGYNTAVEFNKKLMNRSLEPDTDR